MSGDGALEAAVLTSSLVSTAVVGLVWRERPKPDATAMAVTVAGLALWGFGQVFVLLADSLALARGGFAITFLGTWTVPFAWWLFARQYTGRTRGVGLGLVAALAVEPAAMLGLFATNPLHELVWVDPGLTADGALTFGWGPALLPHLAVVYGASALADWYLIEKFLGSRNVYRKRTFAFVCFSLLIVAGSAASYLGWSPLPYMTLTPVVLVGLGVLFVGLATSDRFLSWLPLETLLARFRSKSLAPVARNRAIEAMPTAFAVLDHENRIVDVNSRARRALTGEHDRLVGRKLREVIPPEIFRAADTDFLEPGAEGHYEGVWVRMPDGAEHCYDFRISRLTDVDGDLTGRIVLWNEVTERERRKATLERRNAELERQNAQLEGFANIVSHDIRNPLNVASGRAAVLADRVDGEAAADVAVIRDALDRMGELVDDVLAMARSGRTVTETEAVSLEAAATETWGNVSTPEATLRIEGDRRFEADRPRLYRLLENLFRNAVEHSSTSPHSQAREDAVGHSSTSPHSQAREDAVGHGGEGVTVTVEPTADGFAVADDGPGIPPADRDAVFEQGFTTADVGTGFGLAIVRTICEAHGWTVSVTESEMGGARFEIEGVASAPRTPART